MRNISGACKVAEKSPTVTQMGAFMKLAGADSVVSALAQVSQAVRQTRGEFTASKEGIEAYTGAMRQHAETIRIVRSHLLQQRKTWSTLRLEQRMEHAVLFETMRAFRDIAMIGRTMMNIFQSYTMMMIRVEQQEENVEEATIGVTEAQRIYNRMVAEFGLESFYAQQSLEGLQDAQAREESALEKLNQIQKQNRFGLLSMGLSALDVVPRITMLGYHLKLLHNYLELCGGASYVFQMGLAEIGNMAVVGASALAPLTVALSGVYILVTSITGAYRDWLDLQRATAGLEKGTLEYGQAVQSVLGVEREGVIQPTGYPLEVLAEMARREYNIDINIENISSEADFWELLDRLKYELNEAERFER